MLRLDLTLPQLNVDDGCGFVRPSHPPQCRSALSALPSDDGPEFGWCSAPAHAASFADRPPPRHVYRNTQTHNASH